VLSPTPTHRPPGREAEAPVYLQFLVFLSGHVHLSLPCGRKPRLLDLAMQQRPRTKLLAPVDGRRGAWAQRAGDDAATLAAVADLFYYGLADDWPTYVADAAEARKVHEGVPRVVAAPCGPDFAPRPVLLARMFTRNSHVRPFVEQLSLQEYILVSHLAARQRCAYTGVPLPPALADWSGEGGEVGRRCAELRREVGCGLEAEMRERAWAASCERLVEARRALFPIELGSGGVDFEAFERLALGSHDPCLNGTVIAPWKQAPELARRRGRSDGGESQKPRIHPRIHPRIMIPVTSYHPTASPWWFGSHPTPRQRHPTLPAAAPPRRRPVVAPLPCPPLPAPHPLAPQTSRRRRGASAWCTWGRRRGTRACFLRAKLATPPATALAAATRGWCRGRSWARCTTT
jgi:hypothetical protein